MLAIAARRDALQRALYSAVTPKIAGASITKWRETLSWMEQTFTDEEQCGEHNIRIPAGLPLT